jgi:hypothetical protein
MLATADVSIAMEQGGRLATLSSSASRDLVTDSIMFTKFVTFIVIVPTSNIPTTQWDKEKGHFFVCHMRALPHCSSWYGTGELEGVAGFPSSVEGAESLDFSAPRQIWDQYADHALARAQYTPGCRSHN